MGTSQAGDCLLVHYLKRFADGGVRSSRDGEGAPLEVIVGTPHPRLPGLGDELVGLTAGESVTISVPAERAHVANPARVRRVARDRFADDQALQPGRQVCMRVGADRVRAVRVVEVRDKVVVVDTNHPRCGQAMELEIQVLAVTIPPTRSEPRAV